MRLWLCCNYVLLKITKQQAAPGRRSCYAARFSALFGLEEPRTNSRRLAQRRFWASHRGGGYVGGRRHLACVWPTSSVLIADAAQSSSSRSGDTCRRLNFNPGKLCGPGQGGIVHHCLGTSWLLCTLPIQSSRILEPPADTLPSDDNPLRRPTQLCLPPQPPITLYTTSTTHWYLCFCGTSQGCTACEQCRQL